MVDDLFKMAKHTPPHFFRANATYMITSSTYHSQPFMQADLRKAQWRDSFLAAAKLHKWNIIAWVVLSNHYHAIIRVPDNSALNLPSLFASCHKFTARRWNTEDQLPGRKIWRNYWDTCIRSERDYAARMNYIFWDPVKHGLTDNPEEYPFSSFRAFQEWQDMPYASFEELKVIDVPEF